MEPTDAELVAACRAGDRGAWESLVRRHGPRILGVFRAVSRKEAEDLFQEFWARLMEEGARRLAGVDPARPLEPWLVTVALNLARRRLSGPKALPLEEDPRTVEQGGDPTGDLAEALKAMEGLTPRERLVLDLSAVRGLPEEGVAKALGVSPASVHVLVSRARESLRRRLGQA